MNSENGGLVADDQVLMQNSCHVNDMISTAIDQSRRTTNYKPNIWNYDRLEALAIEVDEEYERMVRKLIEEVKCLLSDTVDTHEKLEHIDKMEKLGLAYLFEHEISKALDSLAVNQNLNGEKNLYTTALCFTLLRKHGYHVSQDMFMGLVDITNIESDVEVALKLFEASHLAFEGEDILDEANEISRKYLKSLISSKQDNTSLAKIISHTLEDPYNVWYNVKTQIEFYEKKTNSNSHLLNLAKHNFNMLQATYKKEVKELSRWWKTLDLEKSIPFLRNRIIESYVCSVGIAFEPKYESLRNWLAKTIILILVFDDVYDVYGTLAELENLTSAIDRWDYEETQTLPECMKICLRTLYDTTKDIASEIEKENGWNSVSSHLQRAWTNLCKSMLVEAKWFNKGYTPSFKEYSDNGWYSSSGPVLSIYIFFGVIDKTKQQEAIDLLKSTEDHEQNVALIFRLCNDLGTSAVEIERGDASSSIQCIMQEQGVSEEVARNQIKSLIENAWKKINYECTTQSPLLKPYLKYSTNIARVAHVVYHNGDGVSNADGMTQNQVMDLLSEPFLLNS